MPLSFGEAVAYLRDLYPDMPDKVIAEWAHNHVDDCKTLESAHSLSDRNFAHNLLKSILEAKYDAVIAVYREMDARKLAALRDDILANCDWRFASALLAESYRTSDPTGVPILLLDRRIRGI